MKFEHRNRVKHFDVPKKKFDGKKTVEPRISTKTVEPRVSTLAVSSPDPSPIVQGQRDLALLIADAIKALTRRQFLSLFKYAQFLMFGLRGRIFDTDAEDLINEAIERTLAGRRIWNRAAVDIRMHLKGCMRSIAWEWLVKANHSAELARELFSVGGQYPQRNEEHANADAERAIQRFRTRLKADYVALSVFDLMLQGRSAADIQKTLNIKREAYYGVRRRVLRWIDERGRE